MRTAILSCLLLLGLLFAPAGRADVVLIVSPQSSLKNLTEDQIAGIYLGKIAALPDGTHVVPVDLSEGAAARASFYARFVGKSASQLRAYWSRLIFSGKGQPPRTISDETSLKKLIAEHPDWIGYIDRAALDTTVRAVSLGDRT